MGVLKVEKNATNSRNFMKKMQMIILFILNNRCVGSEMTLPIMHRIKITYKTLSRATYKATKLKIETVTNVSELQTNALFQYASLEVWN